AAGGGVGRSRGPRGGAGAPRRAGGVRRRGSDRPGRASPPAPRGSSVRPPAARGARRCRRHPGPARARLRPLARPVLGERPESPSRVSLSHPELGSPPRSRLRRLARLQRVASRNRDGAPAGRVERDASRDAEAERRDGRDPGLLRGWHAAAARERGRDVGCELLALAALVLLVAAAELGVELAREELERLADVVVAVSAALLHEDHLVDAYR